MGGVRRREADWDDGPEVAVSQAEEPSPREIRSCREKHVYKRLEAVAAAILMGDLTRASFDVYECWYCGGWHVGHSLGGGGR